MQKNIPATKLVRLPSVLTERINTIAQTQHRSMQAQCALYAEVGLQACAEFSMDDVHDLIIGRKKVALIDNQSKIPTTNELLAKVARGGKKVKSIVQIKSYVASKEFPGFIEEVSPNGETRLGRFIGGKFIVDDTA